MLLLLVILSLVAARFVYLKVEEVGQKAKRQSDRKEGRVNSRQTIRAALETAWTTGVSAAAARLPTCP